MKIDPQHIRDFSEGIIQRVDTAIRPPNSVYLGVNLFFDVVFGRGVLREGTRQLGGQITAGKSCLGLHTHITTGGVITPVSVFNILGDVSSKISYYDGAAWNDAQTGLTASAKMRFFTFLDTTAGLNGTDKLSTEDGITWATTGGNLDVGNMPAGKFGLEFLDRAYVAGVAGNPDRLYRSSLPSSGAVSWTVDNDEIDVEPEEGAGSITGLAKVPGYVLVFKERSMKRWDGFSTNPESLMTIGAFNQEAIVMARQSVVFFNPKRGPFETTGALPRFIGRRVIDIIKAIPGSYYTSISGFSDGDRVYFSIGDITLADLHLPNCVLSYSLDYQQWTLLSFPNEFKVFAGRIDDNHNEIMMAGDDDGNVWDVLQGVGDGANGDPFNWLVQKEQLEFGSRGRYKEIARLITYTNSIRNATVSARIEESLNFQPMGNIRKDVMEIVHDLRARYFDLRIQGRGTSGHIIGLEFPDMDINESYT